MLVKGLTSECENIKLIAYHDSGFSLKQGQDTAHKYYVDDLCRRGKSNIAGRGAAMWAGRGLNFIDCYKYRDERYFY